MFAACDFKCGSLLLSESPVCVSVKPGLRSFVCCACLRFQELSDEAPPFAVRCAECPSHFCCPQCRDVFFAEQRHDESPLCALWDAFIEARPVWKTWPADLVLQLLNVLALLHNTDARDAVLQLTRIAPSVVDTETNDMLHDIACVLCDAVGLEQPQRELFMDLIAIEEANCFGLFEMTPGGCIYFGRALYVKASRFNHSCDANVARVRIGRVMHFIATRDIRQGEELFIRYVAPLQQNKREALQKSYGFTCQCGKCDEDENSSEVCEICSAETVGKLCAFHNASEIIEKATVE